jgi:hypothetical protein
MTDGIADAYESLTRKQLMDLLWERHIPGWHFQTTKRGLIGHLRRADAESEERLPRNWPHPGPFSGPGYAP